MSAKRSTYHDVAQANTAVSFVILAFSLPAVIFRPDRRRRCRPGEPAQLMVVTNVARAALVVLFLLVQPTWPVHIALASYYLISFLFGAVGQFFMPAQGASIPALVPRDQLTAANALFNLTFTATQLLGFAILGPLLSQALGVDMLFMVTMIAFVISALLTSGCRRCRFPSGRQVVERVSPIRRVWSDIREGLVYIKQDPILMKSIAYLTFATTIFMLIAALAPNFVSTVVGLPPAISATWWLRPESA